MKAYLVGGAVRDSLLNLPILDRDWVIVGSEPEQLLKQGYQQVGLDFPVFLHPITKEEYALARTERKSGKGYTGFICDFSQDVTLEQDLIRRDLTINAIALDDKNKIIDPYHGVDDLNDRILRHISPAFREDPLRVLRVARFAARYHNFGFTIATETQQLMKEMVDAGEIDYLTPERVWKETEKALVTNDPQIYFITLKECGALHILFPQLDLLFNLNSQIGNNLGEYSLQSLKQSANITSQCDIRFAALCHCLTSDDICELCEKIKSPSRYKKIAQMGCKHYHQVNQIDTLSADKIIELLNKIDVWRNPEHLQQLLTISEADFKTDPKNQNKIYLPHQYLNHAYTIANSISVRTIIEQGFIGKDIHNELQRLRIKALIEWQISKI